MAYKNPEDMRAYQRQWAKNNRERLNKAHRAFRRRLRSALQAFKQTLKCAKCGESHVACLEFHHRDHREKDSNIGDMVSHGFSLKKIMVEVEKCDVLCANCHRKEHWHPNGKPKKQTRASGIGTTRGSLP